MGFFEASCSLLALDRLKLSEERKGCCCIAVVTDLLRGCLLARYLWFRTLRQVAEESTGVRALETSDELLESLMLMVLRLNLRGTLAHSLVSMISLSRMMTGILN